MTEKIRFPVVLPPRVDISDTLMYVYEMLGAELLSNLYDRLGRQLMDPQQAAQWQVVELLQFIQVQILDLNGS